MDISPREVVDLSVQFMKTKRAEDILVMDLRGLTDTTDYFVICTGNSDVQVKALADAVLEGMNGRGCRPWHVEGYAARRWVLIDFVDVVVHIFRGEIRQFYALEKLWGDAKVEMIESEEVQFGDDAQRRVKSG